MVRPFISIITPTFNHERCIGEAIESVIAQTYTNWEMIIIDDGSTDCTCEAVARYKDPRIRYVRQENIGIWRLGEVYNKALSLARGGLIAILEGDDYWLHNKLSIQARHFEDPEIVLSYGHTHVFTENKGPIGTTPPAALLTEAALTNTPVGSASFWMMKRHFLTYTFPVSVVLRRSTLEKIGGFQQPEYLPLVDYPTFMKISFEGRFAFHNQVLAFWRRHDKSSSKSVYPLILSGVYRHIKRTLAEKTAFFTKEQVDEITKIWNDDNTMRYSYLGRYCMHKKDWENAIEAFKRGLEHRHTLSRTALMLAGLYLSRLRIDMERLLPIAGLPNIDKLLKDEFDPIISVDMLKDV